MLKVKSKVSEKFLNKTISILITNVCNRSCGGCSQMCGSIPDDKLWNISIEQLCCNIETCLKYNIKFSLFGGEPTVHPEWLKIKEVLYEYEPEIISVFTNCTTKETSHRNIKFVPDPMENKYKRTFFPTGMAAFDVLPKEKDFWKLAQKHCLMWNNCHAIIYNNKVYYCEIAAAMDWVLTGGKNGWIFDPNKNPLDRSCDKISSQAAKFCYRCGWCIPDDVREKQHVKKPTMYTETNSDLYKFGRNNLVQISNLCNNIQNGRDDVDN